MARGRRTPTQLVDRYATTRHSPPREFPSLPPLIIVPLIAPVRKIPFAVFFTSVVAHGSTYRTSTGAAPLTELRNYYPTHSPGRREVGGIGGEAWLAATVGQGESGSREPAGAEGRRGCFPRRKPPASPRRSPRATVWERQGPCLAASARRGSWRRFCPRE
jgi:hypothetical protein